MPLNNLNNELQYNVIKVLKTFYIVHVGGYVEVAVHEHQMYFFTKLKYLLCYTHFLNETPAQRWRNQLLFA